MGFRQVGEWTVESEKINFMLRDAASAKNVLYVFVRLGTVVYIGKTIQTLKQRMNDYKNPDPSQSTNVKGNRLISEPLKASQSVEIFALPDHGLLSFGGFHVNLAAGLEDDLISKLDPEWNKRGKLV